MKENLSLLKQEMDTLETIEVANALATIDSPWGELAKDIAKSDRLMQSLPDAKNREQYVDKLLFPLGAEIFRDIRLMTTDPLIRQLMFQSIADDIRNNPDMIRMAQESVPQPKDAGTVKNPMRRVSVELLGTQVDSRASQTQIDAMYKKNIHTAVLRSRLSAEQPLFDIAATEHTLEEAKQDVDQTMTPFAKQEAAQSFRETQTELNEMKRMRQIIEEKLPRVNDVTSLMHALDNVQNARYLGTNEPAPYTLEPWVPESVRTNARKTLDLLSQPKEDVYAKVLKKLDAIEHQFRSQPNTWSETKYKDHMKWLADPVAQANRNQRIINIVDLIMTLTTLVYGTTGGIQHQIEGNPNVISLNDLIDHIESQKPWEVAADIATPKRPKHNEAYKVS